MNVEFIFNKLTLVVNYELPLMNDRPDIDTYRHRIGESIHVFAKHNLLSRQVDLVARVSP